MNKNKSILKKLPAYFIFIFLFLPIFAPAQEFNAKCSQRFIAQNIKSAVLAFKATKYCKSVKLPYSQAQASKRIDDLRCNAQASALLDELIEKYDEQYRTIMNTPNSNIVCQQAIALAKDIS